MRMRRWMAVTLTSTMLAVPSFAQHVTGGAHAGGGFSAPRSFSGGVSAPRNFGGSIAGPRFGGGIAAPRNFNGSAPRYTNWGPGMRAGVPAPGVTPGLGYSHRAPYTPVRRPGYSDHRPPYRSPYGHDHDHDHDYGHHGYGYGYPGLYGYANGVYLAPPYVLNPWLWNDSGYGDDSGDNADANVSPNYDQGYGDPGSGPGPAAYGPPTASARPDYDPRPNPPAPPAGASSALKSSAVAPSIAEDRPTVTLVFKDNRPAQQVHNYALTRTTLYVLDGHSREIPLDQLDVAATIKTNHEAGIDFQLPSSN
jgi:hypothetical protein